MKSDFKLSNLLGTVYRQGNLVFTDDGTQLLSPVGNRISCFNLIDNKSFTFSYEHRKNIARIALNKQGTLLLSVDDDGRAILVNFRSRVVLHHFNFKDRVQDLQFSPDGKYFAIATSRFIQVWKTPDVAEDRQFQPFIRYKVYAGHYNDVLSITWSNDSRFFISTSKDMTARIFSLHSEEMDVAMTLTGHRDYVIKAFFNATQEIIYTVSKDGALFQWEYLEGEGDDEAQRWRITSKNFFFAEGKVKCVTFHAQSNLLVVGFSHGEFRLYEVPEFNLIQSLTMGQNAINTVNINSTGEWLSFGSSKVGQLLVYEWKSESYILKQQGHFDLTNSLCYSPDGARVVTASDDGKIKIWDVHSGFCLTTFTEHAAGVTGLQFAKKGSVLFSASLDGTVRAWDLIRFRNFRTFTSTERIQFNSLAVDPSGEVVVAGSQDSFDIYVWSVQTGQLLDSLSGHEGPISCLSFGTESSVLASASWDKTVRVWSIFGRSQQVEPIEVTSDVLSLAMRPDLKELAVSTLDGQLAMYDVEDAKQTHLLDIKRDIVGGRYLEDRFAAKNSARSKYFTTIAYSFDGMNLLGAGINNSICLYDIRNEVMLKRFTVSQNMSIDGTMTMLNSGLITDAGVSRELVDSGGELSDVEDRMDRSLPGSHRGDPSARAVRPEIRVTAVAFSPTSSAFAAASTEGVLIFLVDGLVVFDPFDLDIDITPEATVEVLEEKDYLTALVMALRLNEQYLVERVYETVPIRDIGLVAAAIPPMYLARVLEFIGTKLNQGSGHFEFNLVWVKAVLAAHGQYINGHKADFGAGMKLVQRFLARVAKDVVVISKRNGYLELYLRQSQSQGLDLGLGEGRDLDLEMGRHPHLDLGLDVDMDPHLDPHDSEGSAGGWFDAGDLRAASDAHSDSDSDTDSN